jgi:dolichol-phosphate mannosyltransferase
MQALCAPQARYEPVRLTSVAADALRLSIVVPTFNEAGNVDALLQRLERSLEGLRWEVVFVDDDSPDGTAERVRAVARVDRRVRCLQRIGRRGLSSACLEGMLATSAPVIAVLDADLQHDDSVLPRMLAAVEDGGADLAIGTRYAAGGSIGSWDRRRALMSRAATRLARAALRQPVSDPMSGFFAIRRDAVEAVIREVSGIGFKVLLDLIASARQPLRIVEVPYTFGVRVAGQSKLDETVAWEYLMLLVDKRVGRWIPVRLLSFGLIGGLGVLVHMLALSVALHALGVAFAVAQAAATLAAMVSNYSLNNLLTYRDRRLRGPAWWRGLATFVLACSVGAAANVGVASYLFENRAQWALAALAGIAVGLIWNYAATSFFTWGRR